MYLLLRLLLIHETNALKVYHLRRLKLLRSFSVINRMPCVVLFSSDLPVAVATGTLTVDSRSPAGGLVSS